jgi:splicing factor 3A subunit 1
MPRSDLPFAPNPDKVIIRKDYNPKAKQSHVDLQNEEYFTSPITGERIPASSIHEHMRISLLDPKWLEQKEKEKKEKEEQEEVLAPGMSIEKQLKQMAEYRRDIFGRGVDEAIIGKKIGEEERRKDEKSVWDGHQATMELTTKRAMTGITVEDQIKAIHQSQGVFEDDATSKIGPAILPAGKQPQMTAFSSASIQQKPSFSYHMPAMKPVDSSSVLLRPANMLQHQMQAPIHSVYAPQPPQQVYMQSTHLATPVFQQAQQLQQPQQIQPPKQPQPEVEMYEEQPPLKKVKTEDQLVPEADFLAKYGGPSKLVSFTLQVPLVQDKSEWSLNGQSIAFTMQLGDPVSAIKTKLFEILSMPIAKQKLQLDVILYLLWTLSYVFLIICCHLRACLSKTQTHWPTTI